MERLFEPWRPLEGVPPWGGVRLLLLGESHYDEDEVWTADEARRATMETVRKYGAEATAYHRFFANIFSVVTGVSWSESSWDEYHRFWQGVFFYNYVQSFVRGGARVRPTAAQFGASGSAFLLTLSDIRPEAILVLGNATWNALTTERGRKLDANVGGFDSVWAYGTGVGEAVAVHIPHPSSPGFSARREHPRVAGFLDFACNRRSAPRT